MEIAVARRGDAGARIVDQAWRTAGVRELVTIPLYLTALLSLPENAPLPPAQREPRFLEEMVGALANAPSRETEEVLFKLAECDPRFYLNERWRTATLRFGTPTSVSDH